LPVFSLQVIKLRNIDSLKSYEDFHAIYRKRDSVADKFLIIYKADGTGRLGIVCSKKIGNSIVRHRFARLVREVYRLHKDEIAPDKDLIIVARERAKEQGFFAIESSFLSLLKQLSILNEK